MQIPRYADTSDTNFEMTAKYSTVLIKTDSSLIIVLLRSFHCFFDHNPHLYICRVGVRPNVPIKQTATLVNTVLFLPFCHFYRTRVRSLAILVTHSLPNSLTNSCLVNLINLTLACEDAYLKLVEVVTVADFDDENRVGHSLLQIWKLILFGH